MLDTAGRLVMKKPDPIADTESVTESSSRSEGKSGISLLVSTVTVTMSIVVGGSVIVISQSTVPSLDKT